MNIKGNNMKYTEQELKSLFDYQQFEKNDKLEKLINETQTRYARELSDEDLSLVNAAGEPENTIGGIGCYDDNGTINNSTNTGSIIGNSAENKDIK